MRTLLTTFRVNNIGILFVCLFALTAPINRELTRLGEFGLLFFLFLQFKEIYRHEQKTGNLWLLGLMIIFIIQMMTINFWAQYAFPEVNIKHERFSRHYTKIFLFLAIAWWVTAKEMRGLLILCCLFISLLIKILLSGELALLYSNPSGRYNFGFSNAQHSAAYAGSLFIAGCCLLPRALKLNQHTKRLALSSLCIIIIIVSGTTVVFSQTRAIWLGLLLIFPFVLILWYHQLQFRIQLPTSAKIIAGLVCTAFLAVCISKAPIVQQRLYSELALPEQIEHNKSDQKSLSSMGIRVYQWQLALQLISEQPFFGYGGATKEWLIQKSNIPTKAKIGFGHFHNSYLELAVGYGLGAPIVFITVLIFLARQVVVAYQQKRITEEYLVFGLCWLSFFALINCFESYVMYRTGYTLLGCIGGVIYGLTSNRHYGAT